MCHHVHVRLSAEDKAATKTISGWMIPIYATVVLAAIVVVAATSGPRNSELVASSSAPAATR